MSDEIETPKAAKEAGSAVETAVTQVAASSQAEIDAAKQRADEAAETSRRIADAAMNTELGARISATDEGFRKWSEDATQREMALQERLSQTQAQLATQGEQLTGIQSFLKSILQPSTPVSPPPPSAEKVEPEEQKPQKSGGESPEASTKKPARRWI